MRDPDDPQAVPAAWPALIALAIVVMLSVGTLGVDLYVDQQTADTTAELTEDRQKEILGSVPLTRYGQVEEIAGVCVFLAGPDASYITGAVIPVDGGLGMGH